MEIQLSYMAQLGQFVVSLWPIVLLLTIIVALANWQKNSLVKKVGVLFSITTLVLLLFLKLLFLVLFPISVSEYKLVAEESLPLKVEFNNGDLQIAVNKATNEVVFTTRDTLLGHYLATEEYTEQTEGSDTTVKSYVLRRKGTENLLTKVRNKSELLVPNVYKGDVGIALYDTSADVDLQAADLSGITISLFASQLRIMLPESENFKNFLLKGGSQLTAEIFLPERANVTLKDVHRVLFETPEGFEKVDVDEYQRNNGGKQSITVVIDTATPRALAVRLYSQHNSQ